MSSGRIVDETYINDGDPGYGSKKSKLKIFKFVLVVLAAVTVFFTIQNIKITVPNVIGLNYGEVLEFYSTQGGPGGGLLTFDEIDGNGTRNVWAESNWKICEQQTPAGTEVGIFHKVHVTVVKIDESCDRNKPSSSQSQTTDSGPRKFWPQGFSYFSEEIAIKFTTKDNTCSYSAGSCIHIDVVTKNGCSSIYVEGTFFDGSGRNIDWSNDSARSVAPGQIASFELTSFEESASSFEISEISCY